MLRTAKGRKACIAADAARIVRRMNCAPRDNTLAEVWSLKTEGVRTATTRPWGANPVSLHFSVTELVNPGTLHLEMSAVFALHIHRLSDIHDYKAAIYSHIRVSLYSNTWQDSYVAKPKIAPTHEEEVIAVLDAALKQKSPRAYLDALGPIVKGHGGFVTIARETGLSRTALYRLLSSGNDVMLSTLLALLPSLGLRLSMKRFRKSESSSTKGRKKQQPKSQD